MGLRIGDIIVTKTEGVEGIILGFKNAEHNSYYHKVTIFCTYSKYEPRQVGRHVDLNQNIIKRREE